jgi:serine/threonine-protein kinase SRK2
MGILESDARWLFQQLLIAVDYCHRLGIANRDIKVCPDTGPPVH